MRVLLFILILVHFSISLSYSQGVVRGKITDETGEAIIGGVVSLKANKSVAVTTDLEGNFAIKIVDTTAQTLVINYIGFQPIEELIAPFKGVLIKDFSMKPTTLQIKEVVVEAKASKARDFYMEKIKLNSSVSIDFISSEIMKKTGDANITAAVARVSGVSTNGGFITVRGIGDRYVKTTINGLRIPTLDPFTNNIKLDVFPSSLVDNVLINKTASADVAGDWAGAYISVETKDYPDKLSINIESAIGINKQSTLTEIVSSQRSRTDWMGYDTGLRNKEHDNFFEANMRPTKYQEFAAVGLEDYYKSIGVTNQTPWNDTYYKLGLIELGLLEKGKFNDDAAFKQAKLKYTEDNYSGKAFEIINSGAVKSGQSFTNNWNTIKRRTPLNSSQTFSIGNQLNLFKRPLGFLLGFRYSNANQYDPNATANRAFVDATGARGISSNTLQQISRETNGWSGLLNVAYKYSPNHSLSLLFMPNFIGVNNVRDAVDDADDVYYLLTKNQFYEQRKQLIYQLKSEHYIPSKKIKIEMNASYTKGNSSAPDFKNLQYLQLKDTKEYQIAGSLGINRFYRYLTDDLLDTKLSVELPFAEKAGLLRKIKMGAAYQENKKDSRQYNYSLNFGPRADLVLLDNNIDAFFDITDFGITKGTFSNQPYTTINKFYAEDKLASNHTIGNSKIMAAFVNCDYTIVSKLRLSGGIRFEKASIYSDVFKYDSLQLSNNDGRRFQTGDLFLINPGKIDSLSILPSINLIYKLKNSDDAPIHLRANFSQSVARPSIRELTETVVYDYELRNTVFGNSALKMVQINNYDFRAESYFKNGDNVSVSLFYKDFKNHIELIQVTQGYTWQNVDKSTVKGIEIEGRKKLSKHFDFRANATFVKSETNFVWSDLIINGGIKEYIPKYNVTRSMYGQAPYVLNGIVSYKADSIGLTISASYNVQGPRLVIASLLPQSGNKPYIPDVYELQRHVIDVKINKTFGKHFSISVTVRDLLNAPIRRAYKYPEGFALDYDKYRYGTNYILTAAYKF